MKYSNLNFRNVVFGDVLIERYSCSDLGFITYLQKEELTIQNLSRLMFAKKSSTMVEVLITQLIG